MTKVSIAALRRRWLDPSVAEPLFRDAEGFLASGALEQNRLLDLRGAEVGNQGRLSDFRLVGRAFSDVDLSHGKGALIVSRATVTNLIAERFTFDRTSSFMVAKVMSSRFSGAHLHLNATDVEFHDCEFNESTFAGGFSEYGFRRCKFWRCSFSAVAWRNTYLRACHFHDCIYTDGRIINSILAGVRVFGVAPSHSFFAENQVVSLFVNDAPILGGAA